MQLRMYGVLNFSMTLRSRIRKSIPRSLDSLFLVDSCYESTPSTRRTSTESGFPKTISISLYFPYIARQYIFIMLRWDLTAVLTNTKVVELCCGCHNSTPTLKLACQYPTKYNTSLCQHTFHGPILCPDHGTRNCSPLTNASSPTMKNFFGNRPRSIFDFKSEAAQTR